MRKQLLNLKFLLMLCMIFCIGGGSVAFAEEETVTSTFTSNKWAVGTGEPTWTASADGGAIDNTDDRGILFGKDKGTLTLTSTDAFTSVTKVVIVASANGTSGKLSVKVGSSTVGSTLTIASGKENKNKEYSFSTATGIDGVVTITATEGKHSIWIKSISVTYSTGSTSTATLTGISVTGTAADLWTGDDFTHEGITVTATYDDASTADVTNSCEYSGYNMSATGDQTVTVTYGEKTAEYTVNVKTIGNTQKTAYTATEAIALIDAGKGLKTPVYVKGIVSYIATAFNSQYGNISFDVSADGTTEVDQFRFYRNFKGAGEVKYTSEDECPKVGDEVIGYGTLTKYNTTYEFDAGNYLVEKMVSTDPSSNLTLSQTTGEVNVGKTLDISSFVSTTTDYTGTVTYAVTAGSEYASVNAEGVIIGLAVGTATIKLTAPAVVGSFSESSAEFTVTVVENRTATTVTFGAEVDDQTFNVNLGETFEGKTATVSPAEAGNVTYSSDKSEVASVDENTGAITIGSKAGTATITASFAATETHQASSAKYYITVADPNGPVFYESFNSNDGTGGNDGSWSGNIASSDIQSDITGWTFTKGNGANQCAKFGSGSVQGSAKTPAIELGAGNYTLTFKAAAWNATSEKTTIDVEISNGSLTYNGTTNSTQTITMEKAAWTDYTMTISGATNSTTITFTAKNSNNNRFFLDEVKITKETSGELTFKAQNSDGSYATFSSDKDVVFTADDVIVYAISVAENKMTWNGLPSTKNYAVTDATAGTVTGYYVPKNNGVLIYSTEASAKYYFPKTEDRNVTIENNNLKAAPAAGGVLTPEKGDYKYYKLAYDDYDKKTGLGFYWGAENGGAFSVKAGSAYLAVPTSAANVKGFSFDGTTTGISAVGAEGTAKTNEIYNIAGQRVNAMNKAGLYIVNGKKMVIKK